MKLYLHYFAWFLLLPCFAFSQEKQLTIRIAQDEAVLLENYETSITLQRKSFKIQILLANVKGVYCYAALTDSIYRLGEYDPVPGFFDLPHLAMAEEKFNDEKELLISSSGWSYWYYDPGANSHRFNKKIVHLDNGRIVGSKTIRQLYLVDERKEVKIKENTAPLFLFFVAISEEDANGKPVKELLRRKVKIEWTHDD